MSFELKLILFGDFYLLGDDLGLPKNSELEMYGFLVGLMPTVIFLFLLDFFY